MAPWRFLKGIVLLSFCTVSCTGISKADRDLFWTLEKGGAHPSTRFVCHLHHVRLENREVPIQDGFCVENRIYEKARLRLFPNSFLSIASCFCESGPQLYQDHLVCPLCRAAEERQ